MAAPHESSAFAWPQLLPEIAHQLRPEAQACKNSRLGDDQKTQMESHWIWFMDVYGVGLIH